MRVPACVCVACSFLGDAAEDPIPELERALVRQQRGELDVGAGTGAVDDLLKRMTAKQRCVLMLGTQCRLVGTACQALAAATATRAVNVPYMTDGCTFPAWPGLAEFVLRPCLLFPAAAGSTSSTALRCMSC